MTLPGGDNKSMTTFAKPSILEDATAITERRSEAMAIKKHHQQHQWLSFGAVGVTVIGAAMMGGTVAGLTAAGAVVVAAVPPVVGLPAGVWPDGGAGLAAPAFSFFGLGFCSAILRMLVVTVLRSCPRPG